MAYWLKNRWYLLFIVLAVIMLSSQVSDALKLIEKTVFKTNVTPVPEVSIKKNKPKITTNPIVVLPESEWVDSTFANLTLDEKIGQLFMIATYSNRDERHYSYIDKLISEYHLGGLIFFQGGPYRQAKLTNRYQSVSKLPLLIGIDAEWGLGMRLDSTISYPKQMVLGSIADDQLIYKMGSDIARQCQRLGIHINFAPVSDINSNPKNPVIGSRSFGEDKQNVARKSIAYMKGLQHNHIIATAKHFPGHGDTDDDSHFTLPVLFHTSEQLFDTDLYPYKKLIADSLMGVLSGHLQIPALDNTPNLPSSLSSKVINGILRKELGFRGLVFTDAMNMKGVLKNGNAPEVNLKALIAGNDILLYPESVAATIERIKEAIRTRQISEKIIDDKVKRVLQAKYWVGLHKYTPIDLANLHQDLNQPESKALIHQLIAASITVVKDEHGILPLNANSDQKIASVTMGGGRSTKFQNMLSFYKPTKMFSFYNGPESQNDINEMLDFLEEYELVIVDVHGISSHPRRNYSVNPLAASFVKQLKEKGKTVVLSVFGTPYSLSFFPETDVIICANQDGDEPQEIVPQIIFGALGSEGTLPVSVLAFNYGVGVKTNSVDRLSTSSPENVGINGKVLSKIDGIATTGIDQHAFPGCQILVARAGKIIYNKQFGNLDYRSKEKVTSQTIYDLASLTKVTATLQAVMLLYDRNQIDLNERASHYLPELLATNKENFTIRDLLLHQSGLVAFYPSLWDRTKTKGGGLLPEYYSAQRDSIYAMQIAPKLFAKPIMKDSVWKWIVQSPLNSKKLKSGKYGFMYSDLGFLTLQKVIEKIVGTPMDKFLNTNLYEPLGLNYLGFKPLEKFSTNQIAPTEQDYYYRNQLLQGTVHDQMAAQVGGVSGHAGLFGTAQDLAILCQMNLWKGKYGNQQFFKPETIPYFSRLYNEVNHRGLGWDKAPNSGNSNFVSDLVSPNSFGHSGFTGTMLWVDPDEDLVFIFLSNRVYPDARNKLINTHRIRRRILDTVYTSISERKTDLP